MNQATCGQNSEQFDLQKPFGAEYVKFRANSFTDKGPGLQYFGIGLEKGIDPAIRSKK